MEYLASGDRTIIARFTQNNGFNENTSKMVNSWRLLAQSGRYAVRAPSS